MKKLWLSLTLALSAHSILGTDQPGPLLQNINNPNVLEQLLASGANPDELDVYRRGPVLSYAASRLTSTAVRILLKYGANPNLTSDAKETPLMTACERGLGINQEEAKARVEIIQMLLAAGADINAYSPWKGTALTIAATNNNTTFVRILLSSITLDLKAHNQGHAAALIAAQHGNVEIADLILSDERCDLSENEKKQIRMMLAIATRNCQYNVTMS